MLRTVDSNFTIVVIVLVRSTTYADQRITGPAMEIAVRQIREIYPALGDFKVIFWKNEFLNNCDNLEANVVDRAAKLYYQKLNSSHPISTFIGTTCTFGNRQFLDPLFYWNLPLLEGSSIPSFIADRKRYPMIVGFSYTQQRSGEFFYQIVRMFDWKDVAALHDIEDPVWRAMFTAMDYFRNRQDVRLESVPFYLQSRGRWDVSRAIQQAHQSARVFLILANPRTIRDIMISAHRLGYTEGDHVFIAGDYFKTKFYFGLPEWNVGSLEEQQEARNAFRSLFLVKQHVPNSPEFQEFASLVEEAAIREYNQSIPPYDEVNTHAIGFHDAIYSYGQVMNEAISEGADIFDGRGMVRRFTNRTFSGIRGNFTLDSENNLKGHYELWNFRNHSGEFVKVVDFPETAELAETVSDIEWASPSGLPPPNEPACWFRGNNPLCRDHSAEQIIGAVVVGVAILVIISIAAIFMHHARHIRKIEETETDWWSVQPIEIAMTETKARDGTHTVSVFKLETVDLIPITASILTNIAITELKKLRTIHCEKLLRILGICLDRKVILAEHCSRGSLFYLVRSGDSFLQDWIFRFSIINDLNEGLNFLHHSWFRRHGRLRSTTCYMTFRFVLKIGDYCFQSLTPGQTVDLKKSIWAAPEILRGPMTNNELNMQRAADIYSFGIILSEVCLLGDPFALSGDSTDPSEIVKLVREVREPPFRPNISVLDGQGSSMQQLHNLMTECWQETPSKRPSSATIHRKIQKFFGQKKNDGLVDELLRRAANHAEELEELVAERTMELHAEKIKIQSLLFEILPKSVALDLIAGKILTPEEFDSVTILFSAVEDFGTFSATCTPDQLMSIMHVLYTTIDAGISKFDVYKVETVIDQYLIASGVPQRNGTAHVKQIASCALYLREAATKINWLEEQQQMTGSFTHSLKFLIGFHTGRIMTGVIGTKMPRFCLFGDTINTASRMESTAEGGLIQFSEASKTLLAESQEFSFKSRGEIAVKGKGIMHTYWLIGHANLPKEERWAEFIQQPITKTNLEPNFAFRGDETKVVSSNFSATEPE